MEIDTLFQSGQLFFCLKVLNTLTTNLIVSNTSDWYHKVYGGWKPEGLVIALTKIATKCDAPSRCFHFLAALQHLFSKVLVHCSIRVTAKGAGKVLATSLPAPFLSVFPVFLKLIALFTGFKR